MSITVIQLPENLPVDLLEDTQGYLSAGSFLLDSDWYGRRIEHPISVYLGANSSHLVLAAHRDAPATLAPGTYNGTFYEGLWNYEAVELFIGFASANTYLEVNLAPNGAWWWKTFSDYRIPTKDQPVYPVLAQVETFARSTSDSSTVKNNSVEGYWHSAIAIPVAHLLPFLQDVSSQPALNQTVPTHIPAHTLLGQTVRTAEQPSCYDLLRRQELLLNITAITPHPSLHYLSYNPPFNPPGNPPGSSCPPDFHLCALRQSCQCCCQCCRQC